MARRNLLEGHKKVGKTYVPPMKQIKVLQSLSYVDNMLPELIWLGLINDCIGYVAGARFFEKMIVARRSVEGIVQPANFALLSAYSPTNAAEAARLVESLHQHGLLDDLRNYVAPLLCLYEECPLRLLGVPTVERAHGELVESVRTCVERHLDKFETPAIVLHGAMLLSRLITKTIVLGPDSASMDPNAFLTAPDSEEGKRAAGFLRSNALAEFGMLDVDDAWARYFWNRGFTLSACEFKGQPCE